MKVCKICGFMNQNEARTCTMCNSDFSPSTYTTHSSGEQKLPVKFLAVFFFFVVLILIIPFSLLFDDPADSISLLVPIFLLVYSGIVILLIKVNKSNIEEYPEDEQEEEQEQISNDDNVNYNEFASEETEEENEPSIKVDAPQEVEVKMLDDDIEDAKNGSSFSTITLDEFKDIMSFSESDENASHMLIAALGSRKLIYLCSDDQTTANNTVKAFCRASSKRCLNLNANNYGFPVVHRFVEAVSTENHDFTSIKSTFISQNQLDEITERIPDMNSYFAKSFAIENVLIDNQKVYGEIGGKSYSMGLCANSRTFVHVQPDNIINIRSETAASSAFIMLSENAFAQADTFESTEKKLSFENLNKITDKAENDFFLAEEHWKKIDELVDYLSEAMNFAFENVSITAFERFSSIYLALGHSEIEAIDAAISALILPYCLPFVYSDKESYNGLLTKLDSVFSIENLPLCKEMLTFCEIA